MLLLCVPVGGSSQRTLGPSGPRQPPPFVDKAGLYTLSAPYVIDLFLASTQKDRQ
jgi:hypothetical protein